MYITMTVNQASFGQKLDDCLDRGELSAARSTAEGVIFEEPIAALASEINDNYTANGIKQRVARLLTPKKARKLGKTLAAQEERVFNETLAGQKSATHPLLSESDRNSWHYVEGLNADIGGDMTQKPLIEALFFVKATNKTHEAAATRKLKELIGDAKIENPHGILVNIANALRANAITTEEAADWIQIIPNWKDISEKQIDSAFFFCSNANRIFLNVLSDLDRNNIPLAPPLTTRIGTLTEPYHTPDDTRATAPDTVDLAALGKLRGTHPYPVVAQPAPEPQQTPAPVDPIDYAMEALPPEDNNDYEALPGPTSRWKYITRGVAMAALLAITVGKDNISEFLTSNFQPTPAPATPTAPELGEAEAEPPAPEREEPAKTEPKEGEKPVIVVEPALPRPAQKLAKATQSPTKPKATVVKQKPTPAPTQQAEKPTYAQGPSFEVKTSEGQVDIDGTKQLLASQGWAIKDLTINGEAAAKITKGTTKLLIVFKLEPGQTSLPSRLLSGTPTTAPAAPAPVVAKTPTPIVKPTPPTPKPVVQAPAPTPAPTPVAKEQGTQQSIEVRMSGDQLDIDGTKQLLISQGWAIKDLTIKGEPAAKLTKGATKLLVIFKLEPGQTSIPVKVL